MIDDPHKLSSEKRLWVGVLVQALEDACGTATLDGKNKERAMMEARYWITKPSRDLENVCDLADVDMRRMIALAKVEIEKADRRRAERATCGPARPRPANNVRLITFNGRTLSVTGWARLLGLSPSTISKRLKAGWTIEATLTTTNQHAPGGISDLQAGVLRPAGVSRARSVENRVSESKEAA